MKGITVENVGAIGNVLSQVMARTPTLSLTNLSGLVTQITGLALLGLALFFATLFYTVSRIYHVPRPSEGVVRTVQVQERAADTFVWVDHLPRAATGKQVS